MWDAIWTPRRRARNVTRRRDPLTIGVSFLVNLGWTGAISGLGATLVGSAIIGAALFGASLLSSALQPQGGQSQQAPEAKERQATVRQSVGPRWRFYGANKLGGLLWFFESTEGALYSGTTLNEGQISAIQEVWLNDQQVTLDGSGYVIEAPYARPGDTASARLLFKYGLPSQSAHAELVSAFPGVVTSDHRLRGVANVLTRFDEVVAEKIPEVYPQGNPSVRIVANCSLVKSVRTGTTVYSNNPADVIYDYLTAVDGAGFAYGAGKLESQIDLASFQAFADLCDELVPLKAGGAAKRYTINGGYALNEEMRAVLTRMCAACDGDLYINGAGKMAIRGGRWVEPTLTLDSALGHIMTGEFRQGQSALAAFNELNFTYVEPTQDYMDTEGDRWLDTDNIALRGKVLSSHLDLVMVQSHAQARRLAKIHTAKNNPEWVGTIVTNFYGFNALGEDTIRVKFSPLGIDATFLIQSIKILDDLTGVQISVTSLQGSAYGWDAELEEGDGPNQPPSTSSPISLTPPANFNVTAAHLVVDGSVVGTYLPSTWTEPSRTSLEQEVEYRVSGDPTWLNMAVTAGQGFGQSAAVTADAVYEVKARTRSPGGVYSDYTPTVVVTATPVTTTPAPVTSVSAVGVSGGVILGATHSVTTNSVGARIYRNTTNSFGTASLVHTQYGSPGVGFSYTRSDTAGTRYFWIVSINGGGDAGTAVATGAVVIT